jgi:tetratricopeptide (TPR) repeat protein
MAIHLSDVSFSSQRAGPTSIALRLYIFVFILCSCWGTGSGAQSSSPERLFREAINAQQRGDDAGAVLKYKELLRLHPEAVVVRVNLGAVLSNLKRFDEAIEQYRIVLAAEPKNKLARMNMAVAYEDKGQLGPAIKELESLLRDEPGDGQTALVLADCYLHVGRAEQAIALLDRFEHTEAENQDFELLLGSAQIQTGHAQEGVELVEKVANAAASADAFLLAGRARLSLSQFDLAGRNADAAMQLDPNLEGLQTLRGMIQEQTGNYDDAETTLLAALAKDPKDFDAHLYLGAIYYFRRNLQEASLHLTRALDIEPQSSQARFQLAHVARAEGDIPAALRYLEEVVRESPDWLQPHAELSALYYHLNRKEDGEKQKQIVDRLMLLQQQAQSKAAH